MAEYLDITRNDLEEFVFDTIASIENGEIDAEDIALTKKYKSDIACALMNILYESNSDREGSTDQLQRCWNGSIDELTSYDLSAGFVFMNRYIRIRSICLDAAKLVITSGLVATVIKGQLGSDLDYIDAMQAAVNIVFSLDQLFRNIIKLDRYDFCICKVALSLFHDRQPCSENELKNRLPEKGETCMFSTDKFECEYCDNDDKCMILSGKNLDSALESLKEKGVISIYSDRRGKEIAFTR